ncbi:hypothetical protein ACWEGV_28540, partial [Streptomyces sp. NPDC004976]
MAEPEFTATGVRIGKRLRSLTRAGQVRISGGRLELLTSYGSEIDSAPAPPPLRTQGRALPGL